MSGTQATIATQAGERPRSRSAAALAFVVAMLVVFAGQLVSTTAASAGPHVYDTRDAARVDGHIAGLTTSAVTQISVVLDGSTSPLGGAETQSPSTTPFSLSNATNTVDDLLSSGRQVSGRFPQVGGADDVLLRRGADGSITHYQVYGPDGLPIRRVDLTGRSHGGVPTPHVVEFERHVNPVTGEVFVRPSSTVRPALPGEIPGAG